ncbi:hypothetical protein X975_24569, partial [Stegodyphus mimosarum]
MYRNQQTRGISSSMVQAFGEQNQSAAVVILFILKICVKVTTVLYHQFWQRICVP